MARSSITAKQLLYDAKGLLGHRDAIKPNNDEGIRYINYSLFTLSNLLDGLYRLWEMSTETLTRAVSDTDNDNTYVAPTADQGAYVHTTKTITSDTAVLSSKHVGGIVAILDNPSTKGYIGVIDKVPTSGTCVLVSDPIGSSLSAGDAGLVFHINPWYQEGANINSLNIKRILSLKDATNGQGVILNANEFEDGDANPNLDDSIALWDHGDAIHLRLGSGLAGFGTLTLYYAADPTEITGITDVIDIEDEHHSALVADIARQIEKAYPELGARQDQSDPFGELRSLYNSIELGLTKKKFSQEVIHG